MQHRSVRALLALAALGVVAAGCGDKKTTGPSGPVDIVVHSPIFARAEGGADTATAKVTMDDTLSFVVSGDHTITNVPSGTHKFTVQTTIDFFPFSFNQVVGPNARNVVLGRPGTCRLILVDQDFCGGSNGFVWQGHSKTLCPANDYGEFCTAAPDPALLGLTWPDSAQEAADAYTYHSKLLVAAENNGNRLAMALYRGGDYAPHTRLGPVGGDSSRWQGEAWTDARHVPLYPADTALLRKTDRAGADFNFGLAVKTTALLPPSQPSVIVIRFDVTNISNTADYRFLHPEEPAGGHTLNNVVLAPFVDADIGGGHPNNGASGLDRSQDQEANDDNATVFPAESLLVAYDQSFQVATFGTVYRARPGLLGLRLLEGPAGTTAKAVISQAGKGTFDYRTPASEDSTYAMITAGRGGGTLRSDCTNGNEALVCALETPGNTRMGWSVGPIGALAPGQTVTLTIALLLAPPVTGTFTSGQSVAPGNTDVTNTSRAIFSIAGNLRTLSDAIKAIRVTP